MKHLLAIGLGSLLTNVIFGTLTFKETVVAPIDKCIDLDNTSIIYRCSEDSIWKYYYQDSNVCSGVASVDHFGGCAERGINLVERCKVAQNYSATSNGDCKYYVDKNNKNAYPIDVCYNYNSAQSRKYTCESNQVYLSTYSDEDCRGTASSVIAQNSSYFDCDGVDCHASVNIYNLSSIDTCNYPESEGSQYIAGSNRACNYILLTDLTTIPYATDVCFSTREGYYEYSYKYVCNGSDVELYQWLDTANCDSSNKYLISTYTSDNYTIQCGATNCNDGKLRTYDDCDHKAYYTEEPIAWDQCIKYYHDPNTGNNDTYDEYQYYKYTCIDGYQAIFYFLDSDCSDMNTFYVFDTSASSCPTEVSGCSNKNDAFLTTSSSNMLKYYYSYIIAVVAILIKQLF